MRISDWNSDVCSSDLAYDYPEQFINQPDSFLNRVPRLPTSPEGKEMYAWLLLNVAYALREHGHMLESIRYYESALNYCTTEQLTKPDRVLYIAKPLGNLYTQVGDLQKALHIHLETIKLAEGQASQLAARSEEHTSELQSLMRISYAVFCLKKKKTQK